MGLEMIRVADKRRLLRLRSPLCGVPRGFARIVKKREDVSGLLYEK